VTKLDSTGLPSEPPKARKAFKHASRFQVRDNVPITIIDWRQVPAAIKDKIWSNMKEKMKFSASAEDVVKNGMFINMGRLFLKWKSKLNMNYVKKGLVRKHMGKITIDVVDLWLSKMTIQYLCHYSWSYTCEKRIEAIEL
jgi:hypothetical protein